MTETPDTPDIPTRAYPPKTPPPRHFPATFSIPTRYHGYLCRSRLEARWMVFFESIGLEFNYELDGFEFAEGTRYLPDFYFPQIRMWGEVKPYELTGKQQRQANLLVEASKRDMLLLIGPPDFKDYDGLTFDSGHLTATTYCLDIVQYKRYFKQRRLFGCRGEEFTERMASSEYRGAVFAARSEWFEEDSAAKPGPESK